MNHLIKIDNDDAKLVIENFMGGRLILPMKPKMKLLTMEKEWVDMDSIDVFRMMMRELWANKEARETLESFGAEFEPKG